MEKEYKDIDGPNVSYGREASQSENKENEERSEKAQKPKIINTGQELNHEKNVPPGKDADAPTG